MDYANKIKALRKQLGIQQVELANRIGGVNKATVSKWERGILKPGVAYTAKLAELAGVPVGEWIGIEPVTKHDVRARTVKVVGELQAGSWREAIMWEEDDQYEVPALLDQDMPGFKLQGYIVKGPSMNMVYPDGAIVFVAPTIESGLRPESGDHVLVVRRNKLGEHEASLKELVVDGNGKKWLWPRSYDPEHQQPLAFNDGNSEEVWIPGIVRASFITRPFRRSA